MAVEETKDDTNELFDKAEFIPPNQTVDEGFAEDNIEHHDEKSKTVNEYEKENIFEKKPILMVNVENVVDETYTQDQELKVPYFFFILNFFYQPIVTHVIRRSFFRQNL